MCRGLKIGVAAWALLPLAGLLLLCSPFRQQMVQGQLSLLVLLLVTAAWAAARTERPIWSGIFLGIATAVKIFPGFLLLHFAVQRRWKVVAAGVASLSGMTVLTAAVLHPETYLVYVSEVLPRVGEFRADWMNSSLVGLSTKLFDPLAAQRQLVPLFAHPGLARVASVVGCGVLLFFWLRALRQARAAPTEDVAFGLSVTTMLLVSPITWDHYFLLLIVPLAILWVSLPATPPARLAFLAVIAVLCLPPVPLWERLIPGGRDGLAYPVHTLTVLSYGLYGLLALFAWCYRKVVWAAPPSPGRC